MLNGVNEQRLEAAKEELGKTEGTGEISGLSASVSSPDEMIDLAQEALNVEIFKTNEGENEK